jgi:phage gp36-like protein
LIFEMGVYINQEDIETRIDRAKLLQLTDDARAGLVAGDLPEAAKVVVASIITEAEGTFDSYARTRYTLPVPVTQKVKSVCLDIAVFTLRGRRATLKDGIFEVSEKAYDKAIKFLEALSSGKAALDVPAAEETKENPASPDSILSGPSRPATFSDDKLGGF